MTRRAFLISLAAAALMPWHEPHQIVFFRHGPQNQLTLGAVYGTAGDVF